MSSLKIGVKGQESGVRSQNSGEEIFHFFVVSDRTWAAVLKIGNRERGIGEEGKKDFHRNVRELAFMVPN